MGFPEITETDYDFIDSMLSKYGNEHSVLDCSELDGFLTAIVSGPEMIKPSTWMPAIWGGETSSPEWEIKEEFERFVEIAIAMMNQTATVLMEAPEEFEALFSECEVDGEVKTIVTNWCYGYMRVVDMHSQVWASMPEAVGANLGCIALFGSDETFGEFESLNDEEVEILQERIEPAVRALHAYWLVQRSQELPPGSFGGGEVIKPFVRATEKISRNDPCPCGSGKKYKKCCGAH